jgi:hypothetical protein
MTNGGALRTLLDRVRAGDQEAATELVRRYEPALRRVVRLRLRDRRLRRPPRLPGRDAPRTLY